MKNAAGTLRDEYSIGANMGWSSIMIRRISCVAIFVFALSCLSAGMFCIAETVSGDLNSRLNENSIEYEGSVYRPKRRLTTLLFMGIDRRETEKNADAAYRSGGQADFQMLVVLDENAQTVTAIHINRDLMADITILNLMGETIGSRKSQICMAYSYGEGDQKSCELTVKSLSERLNGIQIDGYLAMWLDGIDVLNEALGGVQVTLDADFSMYDSEMTAGKTLTLTGKQAEYYLRYRYEIGDGSNASRMLRQRAYMEAAKQTLMERLGESEAGVMDFYDALEAYIVTDMNRGRLMNLANRSQDFSILPIIEIEGENVVGDSGLYEFYPDEDALMRVILDTFYDRIA